MMNIQYKDFIGTYKNVYPEGYCQHMIKEFDRLEALGAGGDRIKKENALRHSKDDYSIALNMNNHDTNSFDGVDVKTIFFKGLQNCYDDYIQKYSVIQSSGVIRGTAMKMQRTGPGGGYHIWHTEQGEGFGANRVIVYMVYLNSFETGDGGETEFLYQRERILPEENTMLIWPASYTHPHRGNAVLAEKNKYIITGWFYYE